MSQNRVRDAAPEGGSNELTPPTPGGQTQEVTSSKRRATLWQALFGQDNRRASRRTALQQAKRKDISSAGIEPPHNLLQRLEQSSVKRSRPSTEQANAKLAQDQVKQAVFGRSRQMSGVAPTMLNGLAERWNRQSGNRQDDPLRSSTARGAGSRDSRPILTPLSFDRAETRDQLSALALRREARQRSRRGRAGNHGSADTADVTPSMATSSRSATPPRKRELSRPRSRGYAAGLYAARMLILSVGVGVLVGTILSMWDPASRSFAGASQQPKRTVVAASTSTTTPVATSPAGESTTENSPALQMPRMGQELTTLKSAVQSLALQTPQFTPGVFLYDLDTDAYIDLNGGASFSAASTIKVPILVAFFQDVDAGKIRLDEVLTMRKELVASGSGEMQGMPIGSQFTALEVVTKMITISDNTAANMMIARLGGMAALNQRFRSWGLVSTAVNNVLPDLQGTNTTSPKDMALLMTRISQGELLSMRSRDRMLDIMQRTVNRSQLPQGLDKGATIAHKTGDIGTTIGDVGLIDMPNGKRYSLTVLVKRSYNDDRAYELVQKVSRTVYQYLNRLPVAQERPTTGVTAPSSQPPRADNGLPTSPGTAPAMPTDTAMTSIAPTDTAAR